MTDPIPRAFAGFALAMVLIITVLEAGQDVLVWLGATPAPDPQQGDEDLVVWAQALLPQLEVAPETRHDTYDRDAFGDGWATQSDGCTTRQQVLIDESISDPQVADGCTVTSGRWQSWLDGQTHTDPSQLDIDHLIPLAEAWASGANTWDDTRLDAFANDVDPARPDALVAVTSSVNRTKGDQDPAEWMPPDPGAWCRYVSGWVIQKHHWKLSVDEAEYSQLTGVLDDCTRRIEHTTQVPADG